jgi:hypothetical protein
MFGADVLGGRSTITDAPKANNATPMQTAPFPILFSVEAERPQMSSPDPSAID